jgi:hypothetical protein
VSVLVPLTSEQRISALSPVFSLAFTSADLSAGIAQVSPATVIELAESAETSPCASLFSDVVVDDLHEPAPSATAEPPEVPPPSLPPVNPVAAENVAERFASSLLFD